MSALGRNMVDTSGAIGVRLRRSRQWMGWQAQEAAKRFGIPATAVLELEHGTTVETRLLVEMACVYGVSARWLLTGISEATDDEVDAFRRRFVRSGFDAKDRGRVLAMVIALPRDDG